MTENNFKDLLKALDDGTYPKSIEPNKIYDEYGISLLIYAIVYNRIDFFKKHYSREGNLFSEEPYATLYSYEFVAGLIENTNVLNYIWNNSDECKALDRTIAAIRTTIKGLHGANFLNRIVFSVASNKEKLRNTTNSAIENREYELNLLLKELLDEKNETRNKFVHNCIENSKRYEKQYKKDPFINIITRIYKSPAYRRLLFNEKPKISLNINGYTFYVDKEEYEKIIREYENSRNESSQTDEKEHRKAENEKYSQTKRNDSYGEGRKKQSKNVPPKKMYGDKWFSPKAYSSISELKKEYRLLAKKYHPDNCDGDAATFVEIQNEMESIIKRLK